MTLNLSDVPSVSQRARALGLAEPTGVAVLPRNFFDADTAADLVNDREASTISKLWQQNGVPETPLDSADEPFPRLLERSAGWIAPVLFVSGALLSQNSVAVTLALNVVSDYISEFLRGHIGSRDVSLDVIVEIDPEKTAKKISYHGPLEGLAELRQAVEGIVNDDR